MVKLAAILVLAYFALSWLAWRWLACEPEPEPEVLFV